ncbi:hypothetical protein CFN78_25550 [Amycolatopsis antarctica]|uniref:HNH endonuclease n=2 Tax=Amycolatopsis antarctica TaxID=1854586 RepID=A0A263CXZ8_9PSEU|nr:hypothetical protein CFN78_25550 [Amycolatopsis antarctica]
MVDDDPRINIQIAHIHGLKRGSARFDETISVDALNRFTNLLLLCQAHHGPVDDKSKAAKYPVKLLRQWKKDREGDFYDQLAELDGISENDLQQMLTSTVTEAKDELLDAIREGTTISKGTAAMLKKLVAENFDRPYLDLDAIALLSDSAKSLRHLPDSAGLLYEASRRLPDLDNAATLHSAAMKLANVVDYAGMLRSAATDLNAAAMSANESSGTAYEIKQASSALDAASGELSRVVAAINEATRQASAIDPGSGGVPHADDSSHWLFFKWGLGIGAGVVAAIVFAVLFYQNKGTP